jgi:ABC-type antimicrobial peptide transport system permease subunit
MKDGEVIDLNAAEDDPEIAAFFNEVYTTLGFSYSLNPDYVANAQRGRVYFTTGKLKFNETIEFDMFNTSYFSFVDSSCVYYMGQGKDELTMNISKYNEIFGTKYTEANKSEFVPHTITVAGYDWADADYETPRYSFEATVVGLHSTSDTFIASLKDNEEMRDIVGRGNVFAYGLYFDGTEGIGSVLNMAEDMNYEYQSYAVEGIHTMTKAVDVFIPIFELVAWFLCVGVIFILMNFASKMINDRMHEIGILKALGTKNSAISVIFGIQVLLINILTCIMATLGYFLFIDLANDVLIASLKRLVPNLVVLDLEFLTFIPDIAIENCILVCILSAISLIFPMIKIKAIKPVKIIKAKE